MPPKNNGEPSNADLLAAINELKRDTKQMGSTLTTLNTHITGDTDPTKGMIVQLDRLQQKVILFQWLLASIAVPVVGLLVKALWTAIAHIP